MKREMIAVWMTSVCVAATASAQADDQVPIYGCQIAATETIRLPMPQGDSIRFTPNPRVSRRSDGETQVEGEGEFQHRKGSNWHRFTFDCTFDGRSGEASNIKVQFAPNARARHDSRRVQRHPRRAE